jgi:hypothetical protein
LLVQRAEVDGAVVVEGKGGRVRLSCKGLHTRSFVSLAGALTKTRVGYFAPGYPSVHPLDAALPSGDWEP